MADRPIIFSGPMVRELLDGRKTMTRRILNPQPDPFLIDQKPCEVVLEHFEGDPLPRVRLGRVITKQQVRYAVGDRLWVRETVACGACAPSKPSTWAPSFWRREQGTPDNPNGLWYKADGLEPKNPITDRGRWVPAIHMPRWASRITLVVNSVKIERLHDISLQDVWSEGCEVRQFWLFGLEGEERRQVGVRVFQRLWEEINGAESWAANPFVVAVSFRKIRQNIDAVREMAA